MKIHMKDDGFDYEENKRMIFDEMREDYSELRESSRQELAEIVQSDNRWKDIFLDKLFQRIVEYDPEACIMED